MQLDDSDHIHCLRCALGPCVLHKEQHVDNGCVKCSVCFRFFNEHVSKFFTKVLSGVADAESKEEVQSMIRCIQLLSNSVIRYAGHRVRAKVQFDAISQIKAGMKTDESLLLVVLDHKQKILPMKYREGQVEYFGKKGMSMLGSMHVIFTEHQGCSGYKYSFEDYIIAGYTGQDNIQVGAVVSTIINRIKTTQTNITNIVFQSDNASCFVSQELIPFIHHINQELKSEDECNLKVSRWIFTEAQTGRGRLDTHFSYLNVKFSSYVEDGNDMTTEQHIFQALAHNGGIAGTTSVLLDASRLVGKLLNKKFKSQQVSTRETHDIKWYPSNEIQPATITASSDISNPEVFSKKKLDSHIKNELRIEVVMADTSNKPPLFIKDENKNDMPNDRDQHPSIPALEDQAHIFEMALMSNGLMKSNNALMDYSHSFEGIGKAVTRKEKSYKHSTMWARYPGNERIKISQRTMNELRRMYEQGQDDKKHRVSPDFAHHILVTTFYPSDWEQRLTVSVVKIKAFFQMSPQNMTNMISNAEQLPEDAIQEEEEQQIHNERYSNALSLLDLASA